MNPDFRMRSVLQITSQFLTNHGIDGLIFDLDNTLAGYKDDAPSVDIKNWLDGIRSAGFGMAVCSNGKHERVKNFCEPLGLEFLSDAGKPAPQGIIDLAGRIGAECPAVVGDQLFTDVWAGIRAKKKIKLFTIMVDPLTDGFWFTVRRNFERIIMKKGEYHGE